MKILFKERQKFTQWWLWLILLGVLALPIVELFRTLFFDVQQSEKSISMVGLAFVLFFTSALLVFFWMMTLKTEIDENEIRMHFFPLLKKTVKWEDVTSAEIVDYGFVGYGIRFGSKYGTVYNTSGRFGLAIETKKGDRFVIGTLKKAELRELIKESKVIDNT